MQRKLALVWLFLIVVVWGAAPAWAQEQNPGGLPLAEIVNDEGGPVIVVGEADYTFPDFPLFFTQPYIILRDASALVERDFDFVDSEVSQVVGKITGDAFEPPFSYQISLPIEPLAELRDVDQDGRYDPGLMIFDVQIAENMIGDPFQERRDFITGLLGAIRLSEEPNEELEVIGGTLLAYSPDGQQGFPSGYGEDGRLFTADDPIVLLPQGYTLVNLSTDPFTFDRSREAFISLSEPEQVEANDFSDLSFTAAFDALVDLFRAEYAFTEYKNIDWDEIQARFRPDVASAEASQDVAAFRRTIRDFAWAIPDGHIGAPIDNADFQRAIEGGVGMAIREVDDGRVIVNFLLEEGPAAAAGIQMRAEILEINGVPIDQAVESAIAWSAPFSTPDFRRLQQLRYVLRFPMSEVEMELVYRNPGETESTEVVLPLVAERTSFNFSSFATGLTGTELPIEFEILDNGYGYIRIYSFADDLPLTFRLWERALATMNTNEVPGIIIDVRQNGGGSGYLADQLPAYFFDEVLQLGYSAIFEESLNDFYYDPEQPDEFVLPAEEKRYRGPVAVLIHPFCQSACEGFSYNMSLTGRAAIVGQYTTSGLGGSRELIFLPGGITTSITIGRSLDPSGEIHIEGKGVPPSVRVPVTEETLFSETDPLIDYAVAYLDGVVNVPFAEAGEITLGETVMGELEAGERLRYTLNLTEDSVLDFFLNGEDEAFDTYLRLYVEGRDEPVLENDDDDESYKVFSSALREIPVPGDLTVIVEVGTFNDAEAGTFTLLVQEARLPTVFETVRLDGDFSIFTDAVVEADLLDLFVGDEPITIFAPNNAAFADALADLNMTAEQLFEDRDLLRDIVLYHVMDGEVLRDSMRGGSQLITLLEGETVSVSVQRATTILNDMSNIIVADVRAGNGIVHVVDAVLLPPVAQ